MRLLRVIAVLSLILSGCASDQPVPVIERAPAAKKPAAVSPQVKPSAASKDWRPETYTVKKGDTLFSIGLEYGYDYKEIAQANNIAPPYVIHVGQKLKLKQNSAVANAATPAPAAVPPPAPANDSDVIITPLDTGGAVATAPPPAQALPPADVLVLSQPKALRVPYSEAALAAPTAPANTAAATAKPGTSAETPAKAEPAAADTGKTDAAPAENGDIAWVWPAKGKVIAGFNDSSNAKGIDIAGEKGQAVLAAAPGKVIYSGSDLRGYGKLVIIKHNKTYLSVYAHNSQILVKEGQQVARGQKIAEMGSSDTDRVKLHFEIRQQGKSVDPAKFLNGAPG